MASSFQVTADLKLDPRSINASAREVKLALGRITGQASEFQKSLDASTARVFAFGATTAVLNSVSNAFGNLLRATIDVQARLTEINAIFQQSQTVLNEFRNSIFQVAQETGQTFNTVADAAAELARQGLSAEETASRLKDALILTRISGLGAEDSVKTLTAALNGFTSAALTSAEVTSKIVAVDTAFAVSAQDLAQGLSRAGSTAEDAGVSFDELLGLITAVEQRTARGGAVIGNAFKSIFTRLSRGSTIDDLRALGVEIDASQTGVQKLQALSNALERISDPTIASKIKELAGGVFQINVVSATLKDLANDTGVFARATQEAGNAANEAYARNAQLNESLSAQINALIAGLTNLGEKIGSTTFGPLLDNLIGIANKITDVFNNLLDPNEGNNIAKAFFKGIASFISGPGLVLITAAFLKIVTLVGKFALEGFRSVLKIGDASERVKQIEGGIVALLTQDEQLRKIISSATASQAQKEKAVIDAIQRENSLLRQQEAILKNLVSLARQKGVSGFTAGGGFTFKTRKAEGYIPNYSLGFVPNFIAPEFKLEEMEARALGATTSVKAKMSKGTIGGRRFIMNNQETEIPNFGRNGDSAVIPNYTQEGKAFKKKMNMAKGFVPNFALINPIEAFDKSDAALWAKYFNRQTGNPTKEGQKAIARYRQPNSAIKETLARVKKGPERRRQATIIKQQRALGRKLIQVNDERKAAKKEVLRPVNLQKLNKNNSLPAILTPQSEGISKITSSSQQTRTQRALVYDFPVRGVTDKFKSQVGADFENQFNAEKIESEALKQALNTANSILNVLSKPSVTAQNISKTESVKGFVGAVRAGAGAIFDAAVSTALKLKASPSGEGGDFDVFGNVAGLSKIFGKNPLAKGGVFAGLGDFKFTSGAQKSMKQKTFKQLKTTPLYKKIQIPKRLQGKASGYVPNFAQENQQALVEAVKREVAAGLPKNRVRVHTHNVFKNPSNPEGYAVTNTRDEPRGLTDVFASGRHRERQRWAKGYVPNFVLPQGTTSVGDLPSLKDLKNAADDATAKVQQFSQTVSQTTLGASKLSDGNKKYAESAKKGVVADLRANQARNQFAGEMNNLISETDESVKKSKRFGQNVDQAGKGAKKAASGYRLAAAGTLAYVGLAYAQNEAIESGTKSREAATKAVEAELKATLESIAARKDLSEALKEQQSAAATAAAESKKTKIQESQTTAERVTSGASTAFNVATTARILFPESTKKASKALGKSLSGLAGKSKILSNVFKVGAGLISGKAALIATAIASVAAVSAAATVKLKDFIAGLTGGETKADRQGAIDLAATRGQSFVRQKTRDIALGDVGTFGQKELRQAEKELRSAKKGGDPKAVAAAEQKLIKAQQDQQNKLNSLGDEYSLAVKVMQKENKVAQDYANKVGLATQSVDDFGGGLNEFLATNPFVSWIGLGERIGRVDDEEAIKKAEEEYDKQAKELAEIRQRIQESARLRKDIADKEARISSLQDQIFQNDLEVLKASEIIKNARKEAAANIGSITAFASEEARPRVQQIQQSQGALSSVDQAVDLRREAAIKLESAQRRGTKEEQQAAQLDLDAANRNIEAVLQNSTRTILESFRQTGEAIRKAAPELSDSYNQVEVAILAGIKGEQGARQNLQSALDAYAAVVKEKASQLDQVRLDASTFAKGEQLGQIGTGQEGLSGLGLPNLGQLVEDLRSFKGIKDKDEQAEVLPELLSRLQKFSEVDPKLKELILGKAGIDATKLDKRTSDLRNRGLIQGVKTDLQGFNLGKDFETQITNALIAAQDKAVDQAKDGAAPQSGDEFIRSQKVLVDSALGFAETIVNLDTKAKNLDIEPLGEALASAVLNIKKASGTFEEIGTFQKIIADYAKNASTSVEGALGTVERINKENDRIGGEIDSLSASISRMVAKVQENTDRINKLLTD